MKRLIALLFMLPINIAIAQCDLTNFRWDCVIHVHLKPTPAAQSTVYCGDRYGFVTRANYDTLVRYQRADVNMSLKLNGEYTASPCIALKRR